MAEKKQAIRILIADDANIFRDGLICLFESESEFRIVGTASNSDQVLKLLEKTQPDILLLDYQMSGTSGIEVLRLLAESHSRVRTILLSGVMEAEEISAAFDLGAFGVVFKESTTDMLFKGIQTVMAGQYWIGGQSVSNPAQILKRNNVLAKDAMPKNYGLTPREIAVLDVAVSGYSNKEIAAKLSISEQTVKHHITNIFDKLGVYNRLELVLFAFHHSLVAK